MLVRKLLGATDQLESFPASGRMVPEIEDESLREVIYRNDRIIYIHMREEDQVEGLSVVHASQHLGGFQAHRERRSYPRGSISMRCTGPCAAPDGGPVFFNLFVASHLLTEGRDVTTAGELRPRAATLAG
jgi:hypothetical protein